MQYGKTDYMESAGLDSNTGEGTPVPLCFSQNARFGKPGINHSNNANMANLCLDQYVDITLRFPGD
jgi:hypothetical protein